MDGISGGWKLPTAGFYFGGYDFGVTAGSMHMARVSGHYLSYECPGTYLAMFQCSFEHPELIIGMICAGDYRKRCTKGVLLHMNGVF